MDSDLDQDQKNNAEALRAIGVEYPIEKRYLITESQLRAVNDALFDASSFYDVFDEDNDDRGATIRKGEAATENLTPAGGCEHWHRTCEVCGVFPVLEGWISDDTYFCTPCGEARNTETYIDAAGVEHTGLTMNKCWELIEKDTPDNDFFYHTQWPLEDDDCTANTNYASELAPDYKPGKPYHERCECHCWLCTKYQAIWYGKV